MTVHVIRRAAYGLNSGTIPIVVISVSTISAIVIISITPAISVIIVSPCAGSPVCASSLTEDFELGAAATIYPNAVAVIAPAIALATGRVAVLLYHSYSTADIHRAEVMLHVIRRATDNLLR
jgi:hypothetical protein